MNSARSKNKFEIYLYIKLLCYFDTVVHIMPTKNHFPDQGEDRDIDGEYCDCWAEAAKERRKVPALKQNRL